MITRAGLCLWRRLDRPGLELLWLSDEPSGPLARSNVVDGGNVPYAVGYEWALDPSWRTRYLKVQLAQQVTRSMVIERIGETTWQVNGEARPDLEGCMEIDLSTTPFCNTLALRRFGPPPGGPGALVALYVSFPDLTCRPSRQKYERLDERRFRYVDLGAFRGFTAEIVVDQDGLVETYEGLFERADRIRSEAADLGF